VSKGKLCIFGAKMLSSGNLDFWDFGGDLDSDFWGDFGPPLPHFGVVGEQTIFPFIKRFYRTTQS
jgi:hypothetical protein